MREKNKQIVDKMQLKVGSVIKIINMANHPEMKNKIGNITAITSDYTLQGTWGNYEVVPYVDKIRKIK